MNDFTKTIEYNRVGNDYDVFVTIDGNEEYLGSARTRALAEQRATEYVLAYFEHTHTPEKVARLIMALA